MPRRRVSKYIELDGPLFDEARQGNVKDALAGAIHDLAVVGAENVQDLVRSGGFVRTGRFVSGIGVEVVRDRGAGYAKVTMVDESAAYPAPNRPPRTFMETGRRGNVTYRKGIYAFRKTKTKLDRVKYDEFFLPALMAVLE